MVMKKIQVEPQPPKPDFKIYRFHYLVKNPILLAQCFALLPISGVTLDESKLQFKWLSVRTVYTVITGTLLLLYTICVFVYTIINSENFFSFVVVVWNFRGFVGILIFFRVSRKWTNLIKFWRDVEYSMCDYGPLPCIKLKFRILSVLYLCTGCAEHALFITAGIKKLARQSIPSQNGFEKFFTEMYSEFFYTFEYAHWKAFIIEFLSLVTTFQWQFCNYFITIISLSLGERFQQISKKINSKQLQNEDHWRNIRQHYNNLTLLCKNVNEVIGELVILAFIGNLYFLSISVLQCLTPRNGFDIAYFWYGMLFTLGHFFLLCWYASSVYEESSEPISELATTPTKYLSHEIDRLLHQMASRDAGISGYGLFQIKRTSILSIISTVVTIELIFIQFNTKLVSNI